jgi:hypothetical protein
MVIPILTLELPRFGRGGPLTKLYYPYVFQSYLAVNVYVRALWKLFHVVVQSRVPLDPHSKPHGPTCRDLARVYCIQIFLLLFVFVL